MSQCLLHLYCYRFFLQQRQPMESAEFFLPLLKVLIQGMFSQITVLSLYYFPLSPQQQSMVAVSLMFLLIIDPGIQKQALLLRQNLERFNI